MVVPQSGLNVYEAILNFFFQLAEEGGDCCSEPFMSRLFKQFIGYLYQMAQKGGRCIFSRLFLSESAVNKKSNWS